MFLFSAVWVPCAICFLLVEGVEGHQEPHGSRNLGGRLQGQLAASVTLLICHSPVTTN